MFVDVDVALTVVGVVVLRFVVFGLWWFGMFGGVLWLVVVVLLLGGACLCAWLFY